MMRTTKLATFEAPKPKTRAARRPRPACGAAHFRHAHGEPQYRQGCARTRSGPRAGTGRATYTVNATQPMKTVPGPESTQKLPTGAERTQRMSATPPAERQMTPEQMERTQKIKPLDAAFNPEATQQLPDVTPQSTQRLDVPRRPPRRRPPQGSRDDAAHRRFHLAPAGSQRILQNIPQK